MPLEMALALEEHAQTPMARRGHSDAAKPMMDRSIGGVVFHHYEHKSKLWENGITINDPARAVVNAGTASTFEDLEQWSAKARKT